MSYYPKYSYPASKITKTEKEIVETSKDILIKSSTLMKNNRIKLISLFFSFIFWIILSFVPYSIALTMFNSPFVALAIFIICYSILLPFITFAFIEFYMLKKEEGR